MSQLPYFLHAFLVVNVLILSMTTHELIPWSKQTDEQTDEETGVMYAVMWSVQSWKSRILHDRRRPFMVLAPTLHVGVSLLCTWPHRTWVHITPSCSNVGHVGRIVSDKSKWICTRPMPDNNIAGFSVKDRHVSGPFQSFCDAVLNPFKGMFFNCLLGEPAQRTVAIKEGRLRTLSKSIQISL